VNIEPPSGWPVIVGVYAEPPGQLAIPVGMLGVTLFGAYVAALVVVTPPPVSPTA